MNKFIMFGILLIAFMSISFAGDIITSITAKDIVLEYPEVKVDKELSLLDMNVYNNLDYIVKGNIIILNKEDVFQNREVVLLENECIEWNEENEFIECSKYTKFSYDELITLSIQKELEFQASVKAIRDAKTIPVTTDLGKVKIQETK